MAARPGWNSLDSVSSIHRVLEVSAQVAGILVVMFGLLQYVYGQRREQLQEAEGRHQMEALRADADAKIAQARNEVAALDSKYAPRHLRDSQYKILMEALAVQPGLRVLLSRPLGDPEAKAFSLDFKRALLEAKWIIEDEHDAVFTGNPTGLQVQISSKLSRPGREPGMVDVPFADIPAAARMLMDALTRAGISFQPGVSGSLAPAQVALLVGNKQ